MSYNSKKPIPTHQPTNHLRSRYSTPVRISITFPEDSPYTKQEFREECDINILMSRYEQTGQLPNINEAIPQYLEMTGADFQEHMEIIAGARTMFNELPSGIRNRFNNDPAYFLDFCHNPNNRLEMAEMGLLKPQSEWAIPYPTSLPSDPPQPQSSTPTPPSENPPLA